MLPMLHMKHGAGVFATQETHGLSSMALPHSPLKGVARDPA